MVERKRVKLLCAASFILGSSLTLLAVTVALSLFIRRYGGQSVMQILAESSQGNAPPEFFSTHPNPESRIQRIQEAIQNIAACP